MSKYLEISKVERHPFSNLYHSNAPKKDISDLYFDIGFDFRLCIVTRAIE